jgi:cellulose synthase/poly-beta-1,6-N-acetylglucosamine synthase-like glycosyltransferase
MDIQKNQLISADNASGHHPALTPRSAAALPSISVVAPAYNEQAVLEEFYRRVVGVL